MKVLWIAQTLMPDLQDYLGIENGPGGGWIDSAAKELATDRDIKVAIACIDFNIKEIKYYKINGIEYFLIPSIRNIVKYDKKIEKFWFELNSRFKPDIIHIYGTEYPYSLGYIKACGNMNVVVSLQGIMSEVAKHTYSDIKIIEIIRNITIRDILGHGILGQKRVYSKLGILEKEFFKLVDNFEGRTNWDKAYVLANKPNSNYYHLPRTLRSCFYDSPKWNIDNCQRYSIFTRAGDTRKGFHQIVRALNYILNRFPDTIVYVAGNSSFDKCTIKGLLHRKGRDGYYKFLDKLIDKYKVRNNIVFLGKVNGDEMCKQYLNANVFISSASLENSPNTVAEAQYLGVPCVASFVGGTNDMIKHGETGFLYRFEDEEVMAKYVCDIFDDIDLAKKISDQSIIIAENRHNPQVLKEKLIETYKKILDK